MMSLLDKLNDERLGFTEVDFDLAKVWKNKAGGTVLHEAIDREWFSLVPFLLKKGFSVNSVDDCGRTALHNLFDAALDWDALYEENLITRYRVAVDFFKHGWTESLQDSTKQTAFEIWKEAFERLPFGHVEVEGLLGNFWAQLEILKNQQNLTQNLPAAQNVTPRRTKVL